MLKYSDTASDQLSLLPELTGLERDAQPLLLTVSLPSIARSTDKRNLLDTKQNEDIWVQMSDYKRSYELEVWGFTVI